jgi:hypothetical protein
VPVSICRMEKLIMIWDEMDDLAAVFWLGCGTLIPDGLRRFANRMVTGRRDITEFDGALAEAVRA